MAEEPDNVVLMLSREIRAMQVEHSKRLVHIDRRLDEMHESMITGLGLAAHASIPHDTVEKRLDDLAMRVERLEKKK